MGGGDRLLLIVQSAKDSKLVMQVTCAWWDCCLLWRVVGVNCVDGAGVTGLMAALEKARQDFPRAVAEMRNVYDKTQTFYKEHNLLDIP